MFEELPEDSVNTSELAAQSKLQVHRGSTSGTLAAASLSIGDGLL